ncbi:MAG TPA: hypothetical protein VKU01_32645 [Bryobacteraceae bacterium]|nr:hypothetical protein [Bryobacteraceae bacterium]
MEHIISRLVRDFEEGRLSRWQLIQTPVLQIIPLPAGLVAILSPARAELEQGAARFITLSAVPFATAQQLLTLCGFGLLFFLIRDLALSGNHSWTIVWPLLAIAGVEALLGLFQSPFALGTYVNRDHYAGLLEMVLPFAVMYPIAILKNKGSVLKACGVIALAALILVALLQSLSRMGFLAALAAPFVCASMSLATRWRVLPIALLAVLGFVFPPGDALISRFASVVDQTRLQIWSDTSAL